MYKSIVQIVKEKLKLVEVITNEIKQLYDYFKCKRMKFLFKKKGN